MRTFRTFYFGLCETPFKEKYNDHNNAYKNESYSRETNFLNTLGYEKMVVKELLLSGVL